MEPEETNNQNKKASVSMATTYIAGINLLILVFYTIYLKRSDSGETIILGMAFIIAGQVILNLLVGVILLSFSKLANFGKACLLSALAVLLIGFSTCFMVSS